MGGRRKTPASRPTFPFSTWRTHQWLDAFDAPSPVSERICWARNAARSCAARADLSVIEKNQMPTNARVIENSAGEVYGNGALPLALPRVASHTDGLSTVSVTAEIRPRKPPITGHGQIERRIRTHDDRHEPRRLPMLANSISACA